MSKTTTLAGQKVLSYVERVEKLIEERQAIQSDIRDIFSEAKGNGYDVKTLRKLVQIRAMDAAERDEANALLDTYASAIGLEVGTYAREPNEEELVERAAKVLREVDQCVTHLTAMDGTPPKIEAIKTLIGCSTGKAHKLRGLVIERLAALASAADRFSRSIDRTVKTENENTETAESPPNESCGGGESRPAGGETPAGKRAGEVERTTPSPLPLAAGVAPGPQDPTAWPSADLDAENVTAQERINAARRALQAPKVPA